MCGIASIKNLKDNSPVNSVAKLLYLNQRERGIEGFGFIGLNKQHINIFRTTTEKGFLHNLNNFNYDEIILHHRLPTSTDNTIKTTHPFIISFKDKKYYFIHNGIIANSKELKVEHLKQGIKYNSQDSKGNFNDSEALAWEFVLWLNNQQDSVKANGSVAFICLETNKSTNRAKKLYFYRNEGSPLKIYRDSAILSLSSEGNWGESVKKDRLYYYDYADKQIHKSRKLKIDYYSAFDWYDDIGFYDNQFNWELEELEQEKTTLEQEQTNLLVQGKIKEATEIDEYLEILKDEIESKKRYLSSLKQVSTPKTKSRKRQNKMLF